MFQTVERVSTDDTYFDMSYCGKFRELVLEIHLILFALPVLFEILMDGTHYGAEFSSTFNFHKKRQNK